MGQSADTVADNTVDNVSPYTIELISSCVSALRFSAYESNPGRWLRCLWGPDESLRLGPKIVPEWEASIAAHMN
jgi:hypothetical protein